jgi:hypothetical protein
VAFQKEDRQAAADIDYACGRDDENQPREQAAVPFSEREQPSEFLTNRPHGSGFWPAKTTPPR